MILITYFIANKMKVFRIFLYILSFSALCGPLVYIICSSSSDLFSAYSKDNADISDADICKDGEYSKCLIQRDNAIKSGDLYLSFQLASELCEKHMDPESCALTYNSFNSLKAASAKDNSIPKITLYQVLYYLDIGCKLNNYDSCMKAGQIYEYGVKQSSRQSGYDYNVSYDPQEAKRYYQKVCHSISDKSYEACSKIVSLTETIHQLSVN